ncbi:MAG: L-rhamnose mutarotase, partial [bacterium]
ANGLGASVKKRDDMQKMADDPITKKWWAVCKPCQAPLETRKEGEHWSMMEEVFYHDPS